MSLDPLDIAQSLLQCESVTPVDDGALGFTAATLKKLGFQTTHLAFGPQGRQTPNLFATIGTGAPHLCFAGHTDVVPPGTGWRFPPFNAVVQEGYLYGRGASDMKGAIAAFIAAVSDIVMSRPPKGRISLLITGDEEGPALHGTKDVLPWMESNDLIPDFCLVGEPTNPDALGDTIKVGRRGSLNATITVKGVQGHVAYPSRADNPIHRLVTLINALRARTLDEGNAWFQPSCLQITTIDVGNEATNVIPLDAKMRLNIRFNDLHKGADLEHWIRETVASCAPGSDVEVRISGEAFLTKPDRWVAQLVRAVETVTGRTPRLDTSGGTSDARFISTYCPTAEFGLVGATMHKVDECVAVSDLEMLRQIYRIFMEELGL